MTISIYLGYSNRNSISETNYLSLFASQNAKFNKYVETLQLIHIRLN